MAMWAEESALLSLSTSANLAQIGWSVTRSGRFLPEARHLTHLSSSLPPPPRYWSAALPLESSGAPFGNRGCSRGVCGWGSRSRFRPSCLAFGVRKWESSLFYLHSLQYFGIQLKARRSVFVMAPLYCWNALLLSDKSSSMSDY